MSPNQPEPEKPATSQPSKSGSTSLPKAIVINLLRSIINILEVWVNKLETAPVKKPNWSLKGAIALVLVLLIGTTVVLISPKKLLEIVTLLPRPPITSTQPEVPPPEIPTTPTPPEVPPPEIPTTPPEVPPSEIPTTPPEVPPSETPTTPPEVPPSETPTTPPKVKLPLPEQPIETTPLPVPQLTPEQNLIASIQNQVREITKQYTDGLVDSIQANFPDSLLVVKIANTWYELSESRQNQLAQDIQKRANELDFSKVEITDQQGNFLARSPVIGSEMIIFKRRSPIIPN